MTGFHLDNFSTGIELKKQKLTNIKFFSFSWMGKWFFSMDLDS